MGALLRRATLPALAVLLLGWALSCLVPATGAGGSAVGDTAIAALASTSALVTLLAIPIATWAGRRRRWVSLGISVVAAVLPWVFLAPYASGNQPEAAGSREPTTALRVMVVNAQEGRGSSEDIVAAVTGNMIDVLVVTELTGSLAHDLTAAGLDGKVTARWVRIPGEDGVAAEFEAGMGVWTRQQAGDGESIEGTTWPAVTLPIPTAGFTVVAGHVATPLPANGGRWAADLAALRSAARTVPGPMVLLGNLNATPWHADLRAFTQEGIRDAADMLGQGPRPTWPAWSPMPFLSLDHVMVAGGIGVESVGTVVIDGSDHRGLLASLRLPAPAGSG